jgi:hypothetical protein
METKIEVGDTVRILPNHPYGLMRKNAIGKVVCPSGNLRGDWQVRGKYACRRGVFELGFYESELTLVRKHQEATDAPR